MVTILIKKTSKKGHTYYQLLIQLGLIRKYIFITEIEVEYLLSKKLIDEERDETIK